MAKLTDLKTTLDGLTSLDDFWRQQPTGSIKRALSNTLYGLNHQKVKPRLLKNKDRYGYTFFTRPQLNLTTGNIRNIRSMYNLLTTEQLSIFRYVRCMLDPRLYYPISAGDSLRETFTSPLVDPYNPFIPVFSNTIKALSGAPDIVIPNFTSKNGLRKEQWSIPDGIVEIYEALDIDVTFENIQEEPIILLLDTWLKYMQNVFEGTMIPYMDMITENEIDYNTRIWRLVMGPDNKRVKKIAAFGPGWPQNIPMGQFFDYSSERPYSDQASEITVRFRCMGVQYNDDILIKEFNDTLAIFHPKFKAVLKDGFTWEDVSMEPIPDNLKSLLNNRGYPYINPDTYELQWMIDTEMLKAENEIKNTETKEKLKKVTTEERLKENPDLKENPKLLEELEAWINDL